MEETHQKEESPAFAKRNIPLVYKTCSQRKGHLKKIDDNYTPPMPPGNEEKKDSVKSCVSTVVHTDVNNMCGTNGK